MVHLNHHADAPEVSNHPHQHAFVLVGDKTLFAVHMTQFHCEQHKYQLIFKVTLGGKEGEFARLRTEYPDAALFLCNGDDKHDWFTIPSVGAGLTTTIRGNIFVGLRRPPEVVPDHFFPWNLKRAKPAIPDVTVTVERIVLFRPFTHHETHPGHMTLFLWGSGNEAHVTNKQIAVMSAGPFEPTAYGTDVDMVASLASRPEWLAPEMLEAGIVVTLPSARLEPGPHGGIAVPAKSPIPDGGTVDVLYRGVPPARAITGGPTFMYCTAVINTPDRIPPEPEDVWGLFEMPRKYWGRAP